MLIRVFIINNGYCIQYIILKEGRILSKIKNEKISAKGLDIQVYTEDFKNDYISLTDIARYKNTDDPRFVIQNWMRNRNTLNL